MLSDEITFTPEITTDPETGRKVRRLTDSLAHDAHFHLLYFNMYYYGEGGKWLVFGASKDDSNGFYRMDIPDETGELHARLLYQEKGLPVLRSCLDPAGGEWFYFHRGSALCRMPSGGGEVEELFRLDDPSEQFSLVTVSSDGGRIAVSVGPVVKVEDSKPGTYGTFHERFRKIAWSRIVEVEIESKEHRTLVERDFWISHLLYRPGHSDTVLFCREGPWREVDQRMWLLRDGELRKVRPQAPEDALGHEFWYPDGSRVGYHGRVPGKDGSEVEIVGIWNAGTDEWREWGVPTAPKGLFHTQVSPDMSHFISDGNAQEPYIMRVDMPEDSDEAKITKLCRHDGTWDQTQGYQPHPTYHPGGRSIMFNSNRRDMHCDIYQVYL